MQRHKTPGDALAHTLEFETARQVSIGHVRVCIAETNNLDKISRCLLELKAITEEKKRKQQRPAVKKLNAANFKGHMLAAHSYQAQLTIMTLSKISSSKSLFVESAINCQSGKDASGQKGVKNLLEDFRK